MMKKMLCTVFASLLLVAAAISAAPSGLQIGDGVGNVYIGRWTGGIYKTSKPNETVVISLSNDALTFCPGGRCRTQTVVNATAGQQSFAVWGVSRGGVTVCVTGTGSESGFRTCRTVNVTNQ